MRPEMQKQLGCILRDTSLPTVLGLQLLDEGGRVGSYGLCGAFLNQEACDGYNLIDGCLWDRGECHEALFQYQLL